MSPVLLRLLPLLILILPVSAGKAAGLPPPRHVVVPLRGSAMPDLTRLARLGALATARPIGVGVVLHVRNRSRLQAFSAQVSDPRSPEYHHYLSVEQFRARFAPTPAQDSRVRDWLQNAGLHVLHTSDDGLLVQAQGTAGTVQKAFGTRLYRYREKRTSFYANATAVQVPQALSGTVEAVLGLDDRYRVSHPLTPRRRPSARSHVASSDYGYTPADLQGIYDTSPLLASGVTGAGETIGIVSYQIIPSDITTFEQEYSLPTYVPKQTQVNDPRNHGQYSADWTAVAEAELDTEISHAMAPGANIILYEDANEQLDSIYYTFVQMVSENRAQIISSSVGGPESHWAAYPNVDLVSATHDVLLEAAAQGQTVVNASGDNGAYDAATDGRASQTALMVDYPCSDPYATCVGGTSLHDTTGAYGTETAWSDGSDPTNPEGSGGGISELFTRPPWQTGPGTDNSYSAAAGGRMVPDVSADADPQTGYAVYIINVHHGGETAEYGGTSAAAPLWAGIIALLDADLNEQVGFLNPTLYSLGTQSASFSAAPFHDIASGNNLYYPATPGYDLATGWGSPDGAALAADLRQLGHVVLTPIIVVKSAHVRQKKGNKYVDVKTVARGKSARFSVRYAVTNPIGVTSGRLQIFRGTRSVGSWNLSAGGPSGSMRRNVTLKRSGSYSAILTVSEGQYSTPARVTFKVT